MAAHMTLSQISSGNPAYDHFYRQVDPANTGRVGAAEAAQFLKKSGLSDSTLGKIWELADTDRKGYLDKRGFFIALKLVACAQSGNDVSHNSLNQTVPAPKFRDTGSPSLISTAPLASTDSSWAVRSDERAKFDGIFESLGPVKGLLSGDKVKPVLMNSKLPLDALGRIWDLSDIDKDGHLDKEEFTVAMHLVHRAREKEPVPATLPHSLIPPSKRKKSAGALPGSVAVLPSSPFMLKEGLGLRPATTPQGRQSPLGSSSGNAGGTGHSFMSSHPPQPAVSWVVPLTDRGRYDDIFAKADTDMDGLLGGAEVKDIFINSGLPQGTLARIWSLADTKQMGKLSREQFSLAMYLIQQKVTKGIEPPQALTPDMIPPSERGTPGPQGFYGFTAPLLTPQRAVFNSRRDTSGSSSSTVVPLELTGTKELDDIIQEINQLQREKVTLEQEVREKEETLRRKNSELQDMQGELERESSGTHDLEAQRQMAQDRLQEMDQQRTKLEDKLNHAKSKYQEESQKVSSLQLEISTQEQEVQSQEKELSRTRTDLYCLEQEEEQLKESIRAGQAKLQSILKLLKSSQDEMEEATSELARIQSCQQELTKTIEDYSNALNGSLSDLARFPELDDPLSNSRPLDRLNGGHEGKESSSSSLRSRIAMFNSTAKEIPADPFKSEDPFKSDPFQDPFGGDPFKESDPFKSADPFASADPFGKSSTRTNLSRGGSPFAQSSTKPKDSDPFGTEDPFADSAFGGQSGFADFGQMSKNFSGSAFERRPSHPAKKNLPPKPAPPPYSASQGAPGHSLGPASHIMSRGQRGTPASLASMTAFGSEAEQLEWAKRESERAEQERLRRIRQQEQEDLELAIALSKTLT